jgi:nucleoid DNA-binding protein
MREESEIMNHQETVNAVARKLRHFTRQDVRAVLEVLVEVWQEELQKPDAYVRIEGLGKLYVEQQTIAVTGAIQKMLTEKRHGDAALPATLHRYYFRFQPTDSFYQRVKQHRKPAEETQP